MTPHIDAEKIRTVNRRYHDVAASSYDSKWGVGFGDAWQTQVAIKLRKAFGSSEVSFERALEIGAGTGYFSLNLARCGNIKHVTCTDISPGMLDALQANADSLGLPVETQACEASSLPFADQSFDIVLGHAVLHHLPDLSTAFSEFFRVLKPGGTVLFAGEPSWLGDRIARVPKLSARLLAPAWRTAIGARRAPVKRAADDDERLEGLVDVHAFFPDQLRNLAKNAGFSDTKVIGEELTANWFGWVNRTLEGTAMQADIPQRWMKFAANGYFRLARFDERFLEKRLPTAIFYNLIIAATRPS